MVEDPSVWERLDTLRAELETLVARRGRRGLSDDEDRRYRDVATEERGLLARQRRAPGPQ